MSVEIKQVISGTTDDMNSYQKFFRVPHTEEFINAVNICIDKILDTFDIKSIAFGRDVDPHKLSSIMDEVKALDEYKAMMDLYDNEIAKQIGIDVDNQVWWQVTTALNTKWASLDASVKDPIRCKADVAVDKRRGYDLIARLLGVFQYEAIEENSTAISEYVNRAMSCYPDERTRAMVYGSCKFNVGDLQRVMFQHGPALTAEEKLGIVSKFTDDLRDELDGIADSLTAEKLIEMFYEDAEQYDKYFAAFARYRNDVERALKARDKCDRLLGQLEWNIGAFSAFDTTECQDTVNGAISILDALHNSDAIFDDIIHLRASLYDYNHKSE